MSTCDKHCGSLFPVTFWGSVQVSTKGMKIDRVSECSMIESVLYIVCASTANLKLVHGILQSQQTEGTPRLLSGSLKATRIYMIIISQT